MEINVEQLHSKFYSIIDTYLTGERKDRVKSMYEELGERLYLSPASSMEHYHNAFPGGYIDHIIRVVENCLEVYKLYKSLQLDTSDFTEENLVFAALHHDLGKLGFPGEGNEMYVVNTSEWHRNNLGQIYKPNDINPFMLVQDQSLFLLQWYGIPVNWVEYIAIKLHDGLYDEVNKPYYISRNDQSKLRSNLPFILHQGDLLAARFEYERWKKSPLSKMSTTKSAPSPKKKSNIAAQKEAPSNDIMEAFKNVFGS